MWVKNEQNESMKYEKSFKIAWGINLDLKPFKNVDKS